ncbi:scarecrow-like protein 8 [Heracleum sosnowskyi]|uniref:Scarecrow-like protein 8 n=1 Tax=Heracleum sosnowskyi TaxID=360622 RepID=A0AAD8J9V5_9APIA|nr:scarecrow-like protein 8 [Heracleum sosnowskyi]
MASGFSGGYSDFSISGNMNTRSVTDPQRPYMSNLAGLDSDVSSQMFNRRPETTAKRSLAEFQQHFQQQQQLALYLRNVKQRASYQQHASPISPLSPPMDFYGNSHSPDISSLSSSYRIPIFQQLRQHQQRQQQQLQHQQNNMILTSQSRAPVCNMEPEKNMMNRLQELEKALLDDDEDQTDVVAATSAVTNSEWSDAIQKLINTDHNTVSPSPASSSSSCSSPSIICAKQSLTEAATAISEGKLDIVNEILTRVSKVSNTQGTSEERLMAYMCSALKTRLNQTENSQDLYGKDHLVSIQMLYEVSPCFKLGFMAANLAILEAVPDDENNVKLHVIDFDIGQAGQYVHLLHALAAKRSATKSISLKITTFLDHAADLKTVGDGLKVLASKVGVNLNFRVMNLRINEFDIESFGLEDDEILAVNFAFRLYKLPDESVSTENLRDELLRRVKNLSPKVVTLVEKEMNANTASFVARVNETCGYYGALFESLDATVPRNKVERVKIEEGLSRKMCNSVACEGRDRVERCEVLGKWRARMRMAGFEEKRLSQKLGESLRVKLNSGTRVNPGFTIKDEAGAISFGWMGRTLTVASAWR